MASLFPSETKFMERSRVALTNADKHKKIKAALAEVGVDEAKMAEGWLHYKEAEAAKKLSKTEKKEDKIAALSYRIAYDSLQPLFKRHRDLSLISFKKRPTILIRLGVESDFPTGYREFFEKTKSFYEAIKDNTDLQTAVLKLKIIPEVVADCLQKHKVLLDERANYDKELGESQDVTVVKNDALLKLKDWMEDFDGDAKIALYDTPQLLEVLGIFVRS